LEKLAANEDRAAEIEKDEEIVIDTFDPEEQGIPSSAQVLSYAHGEPSFEEMESDTSHVGDPEEHPIPTASQVLCYTHVSNRSPQNEEMVNETFH
ncbi:hypothetical protein CANMA_005104, partial [Candida margitis]|uniref:uncharacterized protein n=1 Tax=Candida margitis TaxID=1775924 RepID=UPI002226A32C